MGAKDSDIDAHQVPCSSRVLGHKEGDGGLRVDARYPSPDLVFSAPCPSFPGEVNMGGLKNVKDGEKIMISDFPATDGT